MRSAIALITTCATVLHLAVGCCGHLSHVDVGSACCGGDPACEAVAACCAAHDHDDCRKAEPASHGLPAPETSGIHVLPRGSTSHDCSGCTCVAKLEQDRGDEAAAPVNCFLTSVASEAIVVVQAASGPCEHRDPPVPSELRPPLHERLVV